MSKELDDKQPQPWHGLRYLEENLGKGIPLFEGFRNVFNMDEAETTAFLEAAVEQQYQAAVESLTKKLTAEIYE